MLATWTRTVVLALAGCLIAAACSSGSGPSSSASTATSSPAPAAEVTVPFLADMGVPDPDVFYASEGLAVIDPSYEGLFQYSLDNTNTVAPLLATNYQLSADGKTYTFQLRQGVTFHDGPRSTHQPPRQASNGASK